MRADSTSEPVRISPGVSFAFEKAASDTCEEAKVDYPDRPYQMREWVGRMEANFRALTAAGKTTDEDACWVAITLFSPKNTAKMRLGGLKSWWHRLFFYERYSVHRLIAPVVFCTLHSWLRSSGSLEVNVISKQELGIQFLMFSWNYYVGVYTIVIITVFRLIAKRFRPFGLSGFYTKAVCQGAGTMAIILLFVEIGQEWIGSVENWFAKLNMPDEGHPWANNLLGAQYALGYTLEAVTVFAILALVFAEIFDLPALVREQKELQRSRI